MPPTVPPASPTGSASGPVPGYILSGTILSGGDTTPPGLLDAPRKYVYSVKTSAGQVITLTFRTFPPSPVADTKEIQFDFHAGQILKGDTVEARGSYDESTKTLTVAESGDYIKTFASQP